MKTFPSFRSRRRICCVPARSIFEPRVHLPQEPSRRSIKGEAEGAKEEIGLYLEMGASTQVALPRIINERISLSLFFPGKESRLPRIPARSSTQYNEKHAHYYFIIALAHMHRNACSLLHYRGSVSDVRVIAISNGYAFLGYFIATDEYAIGRNTKPAIKPPSR